MTDRDCEYIVLQLASDYDHVLKIWDKPNYYAKTLIIFPFKNLQATTCYQQEHLLEYILLDIPLRQSTQEVAIQIPCCKTCGRKFIPLSVLKNYEQKFGLFDIWEKEDYLNQSQEIPFSQLHQSQLYRCGYRAQSEDYEPERRRKLIRILETGQMNKIQIVRDLQHAITLFSNSSNHSNAVLKWNADIQFIHEYISESERRNQLRNNRNSFNI